MTNVIEILWLFLLSTRLLTAIIWLWEQPTRRRGVPKK